MSKHKTTDTYDSKDDVKTFMMLLGVNKCQVIEIEVEE